MENPTFAQRVLDYTKTSPNNVYLNHKYLFCTSIKNLSSQVTTDKTVDRLIVLNTLNKPFNTNYGSLLRLSIDSGHNIHLLDSSNTSYLTDEQVLPIIAQKVLYFGPAFFVPKISSGLTFSVTKEQYAEFSNPNFFLQELYDNQEFWDEGKLVIQTQSCLHSQNCDVICTEFYGAKYKGVNFGDILRHYNPYYAPMNERQFAIHFGYEKIEGMKAIKILPKAAELFK